MNSLTKPPTGINGKIILELKGGRLSLCPLADSDEEAARLLKAINDRIVCGDLAELTA